MNEEHMRSILAFCGDGENLVDKLSQLSNWKLQQGDIHGGYPFFLQSGESKIYLDVKATNIIRTANVYPQDHSEKHPDYKRDILQSLSQDLSRASIEHNLNISDSDKSKL